MLEIFKILLALFVFSVTIFVPLNIFSKKKNFTNCTSLDLASFNLIINSSLLLIFSLLPLSLISYSYILYLILIVYFLYSYFLKYKNFIFFKKTFFSLLIISIVYLIISIDVASKLELGWDAKFFYYIKALFFVEGQNFYDLNNFEYSFHPHLGSYFWAFYWKLIDNNLEYIGRLFYVFISCFSFFYVCKKSLEEKNSNIVIFIILLFFFYKYERFSGLQEILIFSYLILISKFYENIIKNKNILFFIFFLLSCNLILWIKAEGIVYLAILLIILCLSKKIKLKEKIYFNLILFLFVLFKFLIYEISENVMVDKSGHPYEFDYLINLNFDFVIYKLKLIIPFLIYYSLNNIIFMSGILILIYNKFYNLNKEYNNSVILYLFLTTGFIFSAYLFRDMEIEYSIRTTMERIIFTISGFYVLTVANFFNNYLKKLKI